MKKPTKTRKATKSAVEVSPRIQNDLAAEAKMVQNVSDSLGIMGFDPNAPWAATVQLSQVDTLFKNNRWYLISNMRQPLSEIFCEHGLIFTICTVPVDDAFRGGVNIKTAQLSTEQVVELEAEMDRNDDLGRMAQANVWNRLYGGAGVIVLTDQDPETPLNWKAINKDTPLEFKDCDMWELFWDLQNVEGFDAGIANIPEFEFYSYYGIKIHKSRVMRLKGIAAPSFIRPRLRGWGLSVLEMLIRSVNQYLKSTDLVFEVLDEFKIDVFKIDGLSNTLLSKDGSRKVRNRIQDTNLQKNYQHAITMDSKDDYIQKELSFTGIAETQAGIRMQIASDMRMPLTKLFGTSAQGFSSGEDDIENYNAMIESSIREKAKYYIVQMIQIRCQKMFGFVPTDLSIEFQSLRILSAEQQETVKTQQFTRLMQALTIGAISPKEFKESCNKQDLLGVQVNATEDSLNVETDVNEASEKEPSQGKDEGQEGDASSEGANKPGNAKIAPLKKAPAGKSKIAAPEAKVAKA